MSPLKRGSTYLNSEAGCRLWTRSLLHTCPSTLCPLGLASAGRWTNQLCHWRLWSWKQRRRCCSSHSWHLPIPWAHSSCVLKAAHFIPCCPLLRVLLLVGGHLATYRAINTCENISQCQMGSWCTYTLNSLPLGRGNWGMFFAISQKSQVGQSLRNNWLDDAPSSLSTPYWCSWNCVPQLLPAFKFSVRPFEQVVNSAVASWLFWDSMDCSLPGSSVHGIFQARILELGCHFLLQGIFLIQGLNQHLLHWQDSLPLSHQGSQG